MRTHRSLAHALLPAEIPRRSGFPIRFQPDHRPESGGRHLERDYPDHHGHHLCDGDAGLRLEDRRPLDRGHDHSHRRREIHQPQGDRQQQLTPTGDRPPV